MNLYPVITVGTDGGRINPLSVNEGNFSRDYWSK